jgi:hypothetical protein
MSITVSHFDGPNATGVASGAISAGRFVKHVSTTAEGRVYASCGAGDRIDGIAAEGAAAGEPVVVFRTGSRGRLVVNAQSVNIAAGDRIKAGANGVGVKATANGDKYGAIAASPANQDGVEIDVDVEIGYLTIV